MLVVVLLLDDNSNNNNNNNHNNILRINRDDVTLVKSGKFKDCVLSWMFGKKLLQVQCTNIGIGVLFVFSALTFLAVCMDNVVVYWCGLSPRMKLMLNLQDLNHLNSEVCAKSVVGCQSR